MGLFRIATGSNQAGMEAECAWASPASWTEENYPCEEDGTGCLFDEPAKAASSPARRSGPGLAEVKVAAQPQEEVFI